MFFERDLKQLGIEVAEKVEDEKVIEIAGQVATKLTAGFPNINISYLEIYRILLETPMYYANILNGISEVNYFYKNSTIYFSKQANLNEISEYIFHECIHRLQEHRDKKGNLTRMGLCEINEINVKGMAFNEAAIQYIVSKALKKPKRLETIYNITLPSRTEYYPIITNLISQIVDLIGEDILVDSTINSNEEFKIEIIDNFGENEFNCIIKNLDEILKAKNSILELQKNGDNSQECIDKTVENIQVIQKKYIETQNLIFTSYFENLLKRVDTFEEVNNLRKKLYSYRGIIGTVAGYDDFNIYCIDLDNRAKEKAELIKTYTSLAVIKDNKFIRFLRKLKKTIY
jgi:hypothetical protein